MVEKWLETGEQEHQSGVEVALPKRGIFIPHETQKKTGKEDEDLNWYQTMESSSEALYLGACFVYMMSSGFFPLSVIFFFFFGNLLLFDFAIVGGKPALLWWQGLYSSTWPETTLRLGQWFCYCAPVNICAIRGLLSLIGCPGWSSGDCGLAKFCFSQLSDRN